MEKQLIDEIKQILIESIYYDIVTRNGVNPHSLTAKQIEDFKGEAGAYYLNNIRFSDLIDRQTIMLINKIKKYEVRVRHDQTKLLQDKEISMRTAGF
ncbi:MAG TPA: hypothetical protein ENH82_14030 [bacterium]|nr:hypothetical protein [bacterium]